MTEVDSLATHPTVRWTTLLRRGWPALLIGPLLGLGVGAYLDRAHKDSYKAGVTVIVYPTGVTSTTQVQGGRTSGLVNLDTEANLVKSTPVLDGARKILDTGDTVQTLAKRINVTVPPNSQLLQIFYTSPSPTQAQQGATAVAQAYLKDRGDTAQTTVKDQKKLVSSNVDASTKLLDKAVSNFTNSPAGSTARTLASSQRDLLTRRIAALNTQLVTLDNTVITPGAITVPAQTPTKPTGSTTAVYLASGLAAGILAGLLGAYLLARRKVRRLRRSNDVSGSVGLPVIARIDQLQMGVLAGDRTPAAESYRRLANVVNASLGSRGGVIVIAGCDDSSVASTVTHNMAATLSRSGEKVAVLRAGRPSSNGSHGAADARSGSGSASGGASASGSASGSGSTAGSAAGSGSTAGSIRCHRGRTGRVPGRRAERLGQQWFRRGRTPERQPVPAAGRHRSPYAQAHR